MLTLASRREAVNRLRRSFGLPEYLPEDLKLKCFSCDLLAKFTTTFAAAKVCFQVRKDALAFKLIATYLTQDLVHDWENYRVHIFACICWWEQAPSDPSCISCASACKEEVRLLSASCFVRGGSGLWFRTGDFAFLDLQAGAAWVPSLDLSATKKKKYMYKLERLFFFSVLIDFGSHAYLFLCSKL